MIAAGDDGVDAITRFEVDGAAHVVFTTAGSTEPAVIALRPDPGDEVGLGRADDNGVLLHRDLEVSRHHARIITIATGWRIEDLGSRNGTAVNGRRLHGPQALRDGDVLTLGRSVGHVRLPSQRPTDPSQVLTGTLHRIMPEASDLIDDDADDEEREVAILFCDLRGYTTAARALDPSDARHLLRRFYGHVCGRVLHHGGTILQLIGDEVFAAFGVPQPLGDASRRALDCAADLHASAPDLVSQLRGDGLPGITYGTGVHVGTVVMTALGDERHRQLGLVGDAVNVAARLCAAAGPGETVASASVVTAAGSVARGNPGPLAGAIAESIELKGIAEPVAVVRIAPAAP